MSHGFDKAIEGCNTSQICYYMNGQKVPTPGRYNQMNGLLRRGNTRCRKKKFMGHRYGSDNPWKI